MMQKRRELTEEEKLAAKKLRELWDKKQAEHKQEHGRKMSQDTAAAELGWQNQGVFSQYINGKIPLGWDALRRFAVFFGVPRTAIFPELSSDPLSQKESVKEERENYTVIHNKNPIKFDLDHRVLVAVFDQIKDSLDDFCDRPSENQAKLFKIFYDAHKD